MNPENSKKTLIKKVNDALRSGDSQSFLDMCTDDIVWDMVDGPVLQSKDAVRDAMKKMGMEGIGQDIALKQLIEEGDTVAANGHIRKGCKTAYSFCDIYTFQGDKIKSLTSYVVKMG